jgi:hypothetical protein
MTALNLIVQRLTVQGGIPASMIPDGTAPADEWHRHDTPDGTTQSQLDRAKAWLMDHPDRQELSLRKAADKAGVSVATMRRAIEARDHTQQRSL